MTLFINPFVRGGESMAGKKKKKAVKAKAKGTKRPGKKK